MRVPLTPPRVDDPLRLRFGVWCLVTPADDLVFGAVSSAPAPTPARGVPEAVTFASRTSSSPLPGPASVARRTQNAPVAPPCRGQTRLTTATAPLLTSPTTFIAASGGPARGRASARTGMHAGLVGPSITRAATQVRYSAPLELRVHCVASARKVLPTPVPEKYASSVSLRRVSLH